MTWKSRTLISGSTGIKLGMVACCAVMLFPLGAFFLAGGTLGGLASNLGLLAPLALCLGAHVVMHRMMGNFCHGSAADTREEDAEQDLEPKAVVQIDSAR